MDVRFNLAIGGPKVGVWEWDVAKDELYLSPNIQMLLDVGIEGGTQLIEYIEKNAHPDDRESWLEQLNGHIRSGQPYDVEYRLRGKDGDYIWFHARGRTLLDHEGRPLKLGGIVEDTTDRNKVLAELQISDQRSRSLVEAAPFPLFVARASDRRILYFNKQAGDLFSFTQGADTMLSVADYFVDDRVRLTAREELLMTGLLQPMEAEMRTRDGRKIWALLAGVVIDYDGEPAAYIVLHDITDRKLLEEKLRFQASTDDLTGLKNRTSLKIALDQAIKRSRRANTKFALLILDLDRFKVVNDTLGHDAGDQLLIEAGNRIRACLQFGDTIARLGGDEFAVVIENVESEETLTATCVDLIDSLSEHFNLRGTTATVGCSIGVIQFPLHEGSPDDLMQWADIALYRAKTAGGGCYLFDDTLRAAVQERAALERELRQALQNDDLFLVFQPRVACHSGAVVAAEALVRWRHTERGIIMPDDFIGIAEECGFIGKIGTKVITMACRQLRAWQDQGRRVVPVSVNLSALEFAVMDVVSCVRETIAETGIEPEFLQIEITESVLFGDTAAAMSQIQQLREIGVKILIDDFGTGYSSLAYLNRLHVDKLKIDGSFIRSLDDPNTAMLVRSIVGMSKGLGLEVTAEGIETRGQADFLSALGCDEMQGYLFGRPEPASEFASRLVPMGNVQVSKTAS